MNYAARYYRRLDATDWNEIIIKFPEPKIEICDFIQKYSEQQKVILLIGDWNPETFEKNLLILRKAKEAHENLEVMLLPVQGKKPFTTGLQAEGIPFFFTVPAQTVSIMWSFIKAGVAEIYIGGDLGFSLATAAKICHDHNVKVRVVPNIAQYNSYLPNNLPPFFIRPEDLDLYEEYIDTIEFDGGIDKQNIFKKIYKDDQQWPDYLNYIILGLNEEDNVWNQCLIPTFGRRRLDCHKKCGLNQCQHCRLVSGLAEQLEEKNLIFEKRKEELSADNIKEDESIEV